ncbi:enoyl-CoA hydratase/isomerase family protein, partial [Actinokineospora sp.]|uniref:enoyl-CoA hydratase/isomerase family protein n=1 Tax=Actinokineospora sp. TaxID=1872133 RepID=UPI003D6B1817
MERPQGIDTSPVLVQARDGALEITLNRPRVLNAMNGDLRARLWSELTQAARDDAVRVVVLRGSGSAFCSGADVRDLAAEPTTTLGTLDMGRDIVTAVANMPKPVVAAVRGAAVGAGMSLALACDLVVADPTAVFHPIFVRRGLAPDWGCAHWLVRHLGLARAKDVLLTGRSLAAAEAHALGLIARLWPEDVF